MTEERKKYLASISKEERAIRSELYSEEIRLSDLKWNVKFSPYKDVRTTSLELIKETKIIIKALKKQLPAPMAYLRDEYATYIGCSVCKYHTQPYFTHCYKCGQKLR